jgi:hypothetical protein
VFALETLVILIAAYSDFEFTLELDNVYIMQRKATKSSSYFMVVAREAKIGILKELRNIGRT